MPPTDLRAASLVGSGLYTPSEAAVLLHEKPATVHRWAYGYVRKRPNERREYPPLINTELPEIEGKRALTFVELIELMYVRGFVHAGAPWGLIKEAARVASRLYETEHPFALRSFLADQNGVYAEIREIDGGDSLVRLVGHGQLTFSELVKPYLGHLDFDTDNVASRWWPMGRQSGVVVDPRFAFGAPIIEEIGIRTEVLSAAYEAEGGSDQVRAAERVAWLYAVRPDHVRSALEFKRWLNAA